MPHFFKRPVSLLLLLALCGCSTLNDTADKMKEWGFKSDDKEEEQEKKEDLQAEKAERFTVLGTQASISVDPAMAAVKVELPKSMNNQSWPQRGANASNAIGGVVVSGFSSQQSATVGEGEAWENVLVTAPVIADGVIYAMDAKGYVSAHDQKNIDQVKWVSGVAANKDGEELLGGGLAIAGAQLFVVTGEGEIMALNSASGEVIWRRNVLVPIRSAPKLQLGTLYVLTADDQLLALDSANGKTLWQHRGVGEKVGFLSAISPAIGDNFVVVAYSSGELYGLAADTGEQIWNDSLAMARKTTATSVFNGFDGDPVMAGGVVFASSSNGLMAATHILSGRRLWEQPISAADTPALTNNFLFALTTDAELVAIHARDGRVKWVKPLPQFEDMEDKKGLLQWHGPMLVNDQLLVLGEHGTLLLLSPEDGSIIAEHDIPEGIRMSPVVAGGSVYGVTSSAKLVVLQ